MDREHKSDDDDDVSSSPSQFSLDNCERNVEQVARNELMRTRNSFDINQNLLGSAVRSTVASSSSSSYFSAHCEMLAPTVEPSDAATVPTEERSNTRCTMYYGRSLRYLTASNARRRDDKQPTEVLFSSPFELKSRSDLSRSSQSSRLVSSSELSVSEHCLGDDDPVRCLDGAEQGSDDSATTSRSVTDMKTNSVSHRTVSARVRDSSKHVIANDGDCLKSPEVGDVNSCSGLPEIYLMPSDVRDCGSVDGGFNFACNKDDDDDWSDNNEEAAVSTDHENNSDDTAGSSLVLSSMGAAYFRDKPRGEPMGSESGGGGGAPPLPAATFTTREHSETSDEELNAGESVGFQTSVIGTWSSCVRGDVEGADYVDDQPVPAVAPSNNLPAFANLSLNVDNEVMDSSASVRPPLVGQSEENQDVASAVVDYKQKLDPMPPLPPPCSLSDEELDSQASVSLSSESRDSLAIRVSNLLNASIQSDVSQNATEGNAVLESEPSADTGGSKIDVPIELSLPGPSVRRRDYYVPVDDDLFKQNSSLESTDNEQAPSASGYHSDQRASSPSVVSVSSMASSRRLEWDSGADIGYGGPKVLYGLSTLERMAIGTFLQRTEPEGKSALGKDKLNRQGATAATPQAKSKDNDSVASLEDVVVSVVEGTNPPCPHVATDEEELRSNSFPESEDTDCELFLCYKMQLSKESAGSNSESQAQRQTEEETLQERLRSKKLHTGTVRSSKVRGSNRCPRAETFPVNIKAQRSSSLTDLCDMTRLIRRGTPLHSNSVSDIYGLNVPESNNRSVSSSASMVSSSSSSTVVGTPFDMKQPPVSSTPFCSTAIDESSANLALKPNFNTPVNVGVSTTSAQESPSWMQQEKKNEAQSPTKREEDFNQLVSITGRLFRDLCPAPTASERQKLLRAFLEVVTNDHSNDVQLVTQSAISREPPHKSTFVVQEVSTAVSAVRSSLSSVAKPNSEFNVPLSNDRPSLSSGSVNSGAGCVDVPSSPPSVQLETHTDSDVQEASVVHHQDEEAAAGLSLLSVRCKENRRGPSSSSSSRVMGTQRSSSRGNQPRHTAAALPPRMATLNTKLCSASTSGGSESTMDTIRERKQQQYADDTLASSFEYYGVPSAKILNLFRAPLVCSKGPRDSYLWSVLRRSRAEKSSTTSSRSSTKLTTTLTTSSDDVHTSSSTNNDRRSARVTVQKVSYVAGSFPTNDVQLDSSTPSPTGRVGGTRRFLDRLQVMEKLNHEGLSVVKELVRRQRNSYIRKLKREVDWLERVEAILIGSEIQPPQQLGAVNGRKNPPRQLRPSRFPLDRDPPVGIIPRHVQDFGQCFPTPHVSEDDAKFPMESRSLSVGVQTSDLLLGNTMNVLNQHSGAQNDRPFVNISLPVTKRNRKQTSPLTRQLAGPRRNGQTAAKRTLHTPSLIRQRPVAWFYPLGNGQPRHLISAGRSVTFRRSPADGAQADQLGFPATYPASRPGATQEPLSLQEAFRLLKPDVILSSMARQERLKAKQKMPERMKLVSATNAYMGKHTKPLPMSSQHHNPQPRNLSHREMRDQTEKLYHVLSEVAKRQELKRREELYRTNRLMAQMFKKKLQEKVLQGKVSMSNTQKCM